MKDMTADELRILLGELGACHEARQWADGKTLAEAWNTCKRAGWMLWLVGRMVGKRGWPKRKQLVLAACACAETCLPIWESTYPEDKRPRLAIETARQWAAGKSTLRQVKYAYAAAYTAAYAANACAANAAYAAADAADAAYAAYAAYADACAANAAYAAYVAGKTDSLRKMAYLVRSIIKVTP